MVKILGGKTTDNIEQILSSLPTEVANILINNPKERKKFSKNPMKWVKNNKQLIDNAIVNQNNMNLPQITQEDFIYQEQQLMNEGQGNTVPIQTVQTNNYYQQTAIIPPIANNQNDIYQKVANNSENQPTEFYEDRIELDPVEESIKDYNMEATTVNIEECAKFLQNGITVSIHIFKMGIWQGVEVIKIPDEIILDFNKHHDYGIYISAVHSWLDNYCLNNFRGKICFSCSPSIGFPFMKRSI